MAEHVGTGLNPQAPWSGTLFTQAANLGAPDRTSEKQALQILILYPDW